MAEFFCLGIPALALLGVLIWSFAAGIRAWSMAGRASGEHAATLQFLGLNLCEPLINTAIVSVGLLSFARLSGSGAATFAFLATAPMAILLAPALGLRFGDADLRDTCRAILQRGLARWIINGGSLAGIGLVSASGLGAYRDMIFVFCFVILPLVSIGVLVMTIAWAKDLLSGPLYATRRTPVTLPTTRAVAARPAVTARRVVAARIGSPQRAPCPGCRAPAPLEAPACPHCGLVFASRIPEVLRDLPRYTVLRPLIAGGMSRVYLAHDRAIGLPVVLKSAAGDVEADPARHAEARRCLAHEAELLRELWHPGIVPWLGWYPDAPEPFLALEYVPGISLEHRLEEGPLATHQALAYIAGVADTVCYLAGRPQPIVHCDIKPGNLIATDTGDMAVLLDFGSAVMPTESVHVSFRRDYYGTPGYAAPEQYRGEVSLRSDIYSLAATFYHLLTGDDPTSHPLAFPALGLLPGELAAVLSSALEREPALRPPPIAFRDTLRALLGRYR